MSHFPVLVLTESGTEEEVARLLAPYDEAGEWFADGSRWDWWVVGGRWTGALDGYDPSQDWRNVEGCALCAGSGTRPSDLRPVGVAIGGGDPNRPRWEAGSEWALQCGGCNGCGGLGWRLKWSLEPHAGDVQPVAVALAALEREERPLVPHAIVSPDGAWHENGRAGWFGSIRPNEAGVVPSEEGQEAWPEQAQRILREHPGTVAVLVDCHV